MIGKTLGNRYLIEEKVGVGGMAKVYRAKDTLLNRDVAVKVLKDEYMDDEDFLKKFAMEAQSAASLTHANIVSVYDVGSSEVDNKRHNYIVMELVVGKTLKEIIQEKGPLSPDEIVNYGIQIAKALECAHNNKVIHRDIKPHNILIDNDNNLKVTDFGIARISSAATITYTSSVLGTVHYISPEQAKGKFIDEKSDIYSLGIVLYEMATGQVPFDADNAVGIALKHLQDPLVAPKELIPNLPDGLNNIIVKALEKDPKDRFQSAKEIKSALQNYSEFILPYEEDALSGKTVRMNPITDGDYDTRSTLNRENKQVEETPVEEEAVYEMRKDKPEKKKKKKSSKFKTIVLPILMALAVIVLGVFGTKALKGDKKELEKVPAVKDVTEDRAIKILENSGFIAEVVKRQESSDIKAGNVISQDPEAGATLEKGEKVNLIISSGIKEIEVPDLDKMSLDEAENKLKEYELKRGVVNKEYSDTVPEGKIMGQKPAFGEKVQQGSSVNVTISRGPKVKKATVPNILGKDISEATRLINNSGLVVGNVDKKNSDEYPEGQVIWQSYKAGDQLEEKQAIDLIISLGKKEEEPQQMNYTFRVAPPKEEGTYKVVIKKVTNNGDVNVYSSEFKAEDGIQNIRLTGPVNSKYKVYIDNELAQTS